MVILCIGYCSIDDVYSVDKYPEEDSTVGSRTIFNRCTEHSWERGGNASNNATVLAVLGADVEFFGTIADDHLKQFFLDDMDSFGIKHESCPILQSVKAGVSAVICSLETGSRTIIHCNGALPELSYDQFKQNINLNNYSWIHFEGRNENGVTKMLSDIREYNKLSAPGNCSSEVVEGLLPNYKRSRIAISIEVEKRIETIGVLLPFADVIFLGKDYAMMKGATDVIHAVEIFTEKLVAGTLLVCPWGDQGAAFTLVGDPMKKIVKVDACPPDKIIDSLGAGDTFNAAVIYALSKDLPIEKSVQIGCKVAGAKLGSRGFRHIPKIVDVIQ